MTGDYHVAVTILAFANFGQLSPSLDRVPVLWEPEAARVMTQLEGDRSLARIHAFVRRMLGRLERDPSDPKLGTRQFSIDRYAQMRCTPARIGDWRIFWKSGPEPDEITIIFIAEATL